MEFASQAMRAPEETVLEMLASVAGTSRLQAALSLGWMPIAAL
jgi:hypothetical protein